jgi:hypothetical protein
MVRRCVGLAVADAETRFRKIKGCRDLPVLALALRGAADQATAIA